MHGGSWHFFRKIFEKKLGGARGTFWSYGAKLGKISKNQSGPISMKFGMHNKRRNTRILALKLIQKTGPNWSEKKR